MTAAWEDREKAAEGRPDAQEDSVSLYTVHSAKGLEWPIVIPVNMSTMVKAHSGIVLDRETSYLSCKILGVAPPGHADVAETELAEARHERVRLWYVAATRARELLVLPRFSRGVSKSSWFGAANFPLEDLPPAALSAVVNVSAAAAAANATPQTAKLFLKEAETIAAASKHLKWMAPSRDEDLNAVPPKMEEAAIIGMDEHQEMMRPLIDNIQGGRERGLVIHKLFEEVLNGETPMQESALSARADELLKDLGIKSSPSSSDGLSSVEIAHAVLKGLNVPEVAAVRERLIPECPVTSAQTERQEEFATCGIADAVAIAADGNPELVIDWKSDVTPTPTRIDTYKGQVTAYLKATKIRRGLIVFVTSGRIVDVRAD